MPTQVKPMLATLVSEPFDRPGWLFEIKWDGYRAIAEVRKRGVRLYSRNQLSFDAVYGRIARALARLPPCTFCVPTSHCRSLWHAWAAPPDKRC